MRYYEQRYPEVDELVMVQVRQIAEMVRVLLRAPYTYEIRTHMDLLYMPVECAHPARVSVIASDIYALAELP